MSEEVVQPGEIYEDANGHRYLRKPCGADLPWVLIGRDGLIVERVEDVPAHPLRKLAPPVLEQLDWEDCHQDEAAGIRTYLAEGNLVGIEGSRHGDDISPDAALHLAARLASLAAKAKANEPDPAEVEELAALIRSELYPHSEAVGLRPSEADRTTARAALRWMRGKERAS